MRSISSRQNPIVRVFRKLSKDPDPAGVRLLLEGPHLVREAQTSAAIEIVVVAASQLDRATEEAALAQALERTGVDVFSANDATFAAVSPVKTPSGIVAIARRKPVTASAICHHPRAFVLAAADIQDPGNLGSLMRAAEAGGITGVLVCGASANPFSWKALRGSMGSSLRLPIASGLGIDEALACMTTAGIRTIASVPHGGRSPDAVDWTGSVGLWLGGEGMGLRDGTVEGCDERVTIPMMPPVESLNVAVAGGILIYEGRRARA